MNHPPMTNNSSQRRQQGRRRSFGDLVLALVVGEGGSDDDDDVNKKPPPKGGGRPQRRGKETSSGGGNDARRRSFGDLASVLGGINFEEDSDDDDDLLWMGRNGDDAMTRGSARLSTVPSGRRSSRRPTNTRTQPSPSRPAAATAQQRQSHGGIHRATSRTTYAARSNNMDSGGGDGIRRSRSFGDMILALVGGGAGDGEGLDLENKGDNNGGGGGDGNWTDLEGDDEYEGPTRSRRAARRRSKSVDAAAAVLGHDSTDFQQLPAGAGGRSSAAAAAAPPPAAQLRSSPPRRKPRRRKSFGDMVMALGQMGDADDEEEAQRKKDEALSSVDLYKMAKESTASKPRRRKSFIFTVPDDDKEQQMLDEIRKRESGQRARLEKLKQSRRKELAEVEQKARKHEEERKKEWAGGRRASLLLQTKKWSSGSALDQLGEEMEAQEREWRACASASAGPAAAAAAAAAKHRKKVQQRSSATPKSGNQTRRRQSGLLIQAKKKWLSSSALDILGNDLHALDADDDNEDMADAADASHQRTRRATTVMDYLPSFAKKNKSQADLRPNSGLAIYEKGQSLSSQRMYREAIGYYHRALQLQREVNGPDHVNCGNILHDTGVALRKLGEYYGAKTALEEALYIRQMNLGTGSPEVAQTTNEIWRALDEFQRQQVEIGGGGGGVGTTGGGDDDENDVVGGDEDHNDDNERGSVRDGRSDSCDGNKAVARGMVNVPSQAVFDAFSKSGDEFSADELDDITTDSDTAGFGNSHRGHDCGRDEGNDGTLGSCNYNDGADGGDGMADSRSEEGRAASPPKVIIGVLKGCEDDSDQSSADGSINVTSDMKTIISIYEDSNKILVETGESRLSAENDGFEKDDHHRHNYDESAGTNDYSGTIITDSEVERDEELVEATLNLSRNDLMSAMKSIDRKTLHRRSSYRTLVDIDSSDMDGYLDDVLSCGETD